MKNIEKVLIFLIGVFILIRFIRLDVSPPSLSNDEISIAYDAYSISKTLRDEHNHFLPLSFQSNNSFKAPLAIYLSVPFTVILGNQEMSVRLPSAILGGLTVVVLGFLVFELTKNRILALISSLVLAAAPWHIFTSRMALESNIALFFFVLGIYLVFVGIRTLKFWALFGAAVALALSIYSYHTQWGFVPIILLIIIGFNFKRIIKTPIFYVVTILFLVMVVPIFFDAVSNLSTDARANTVNILKDPNFDHFLKDPNSGLLTKLSVFVTVFLSKYSEYTDFGYLFYNGAMLLSSANPYQSGLFLFPLLPFFVAGLFKVGSFFGMHTKFIYTWVLITPIIPALTIGDLNNPRNLVSIIPYSLVIASGVLFVFSYFKNNRYFWGGMILVFGIFTYYFLAVYFYHFPRQESARYQYGYKQVALFIKEHNLEYQKIIVDRRFGTTVHYQAGVPHLYIGYFAEVDPNLLLKRIDTPTALYFDKYEMRNIDWNAETPRKGYLYAVPPPNEPHRLEDMNLVAQILYPNLEPAFNLYTPK